VRLLPELRSGKVECDDFAAVEVADKIQPSHGVTNCRPRRMARGDAAKEI
jgi:hypothetical protein